MKTPEERLRASFALPAALPFLSLAAYPSTVARLEGVSGATGVDVWILRDDLISPSYAGNKVRKLELLLGDARAKGAGSLITIGALGSHQVIATAVHGAALGLRTYAAVYRQPVTPYVRANVELALRLNVDLTPFEPADLASVLGAIEARAPAAYLVPSGGSSPLGNLGYVAAALELAEQVERGELPHPDVIVVPSGTGGTVAGLAFGAAVAGLATTVLGVHVTPDDAGSMRAVEQQIVGMETLIRRRRGAVAAHRAPSYRVIDDYVGTGYGGASAQADAAIAEASRLDRLVLEPTYTGRAMAGLLTHARSLPRRSTVLFVQTYDGRNARVLPPSTLEVPPAPSPAIARWLAEP